MITFKKGTIFAAGIFNIDGTYKIWCKVKLFLK